MTDPFASGMTWDRVIADVAVFMDNPLIKSALISIIAIFIAGIAARAVIHGLMNHHHAMHIDSDNDGGAE